MNSRFFPAFEAQAEACGYLHSGTARPPVIRNNFKTSSVILNAVKDLTHRKYEIRNEASLRSE
jgi:hypothetical protein